jgi:hypothetical protein
MNKKLICRLRIQGRTALQVAEALDENHTEARKGELINLFRNCCNHNATSEG